MEPTSSPEATPAADETPATGGDDSHGRPDVAGRYIVLLDEGTDTSATVERMGRQKGIKAERTFGKTIRGFSARLDSKQRKALEADPSVFAVVPDEVIQVAGQTTPTGVSRIFTKSNTIAKINGVDERVDADVAIVDTGIQPNHPDLNVVGGYNCSTSNRAAWRDVQGHGTHVAGTVAAKDNTTGVVGVRPGARLWAVKILNDDGYGLLSWYVCGLDWILAQRDPADPSRPLIEAANMSVAKSGEDDPDCGASEKDILHLAICRVVKGGITVVAAAGNDQMSAARWVPASYNEVITVSALADTDGKPGALGGHRCFSWGSYDSDDTYANFSNYGSDIDIIAPGKCIWSTKPGSTYGYYVGDLDGHAGSDRCGGAVQGQPADGHAVRGQGSAAVPRQPQLEDIHRPGLVPREAARRVEARRARDVLAERPDRRRRARVRWGRLHSDHDQPQLDVLRARPAVRVRDPCGLDGKPGPRKRVRLVGEVGAAQRDCTRLGRGRHVRDHREGPEPGPHQHRSSPTITVGKDLPTALAPTSAQVKTNVALNASSAPAVITWPAANDLSSSISGYESQWSRDGGDWTGTIATSGSVRTVVRNLAFNSSYQFRVRARDAAGNWSTWAATSVPYKVTHTSDRSPSVHYSASWKKASSSSATSDTLMTTTSNGATARYTFTGKGIAVVMPRSSSRAWIEVRIDGTYVGKISL